MSFTTSLCFSNSAKAGIHVQSFPKFFSTSTTRLKQRLVIIGSGWGGYEVLRKVNKKRWGQLQLYCACCILSCALMSETHSIDVTVLSSNTYFAFTPLLASCAVGTLEYRTALEPVRAYAPQANSFQVWCDAIDFKRKLLECTSATPPAIHNSSESQNILSKLSNERGRSVTGPKFTVNYDKLVIAVGAYAQTFGIPGVKENAHFLKDIKDARAIRTRILELFGQANLPILSDVDRCKLLHFCIVGGGPTGVEFAAELHDLLHTDLARAYPHLVPMAKISLYDVAPQILGNFDQGLVKYATDRFKRNGIAIKSQHHVERVGRGSMVVKEEGEVPFGLLVWSTGLAPNPLIESISEFSKDEKTGSLLVNEQLNVVRQDNQSVVEDIWAIGDACVVESGQARLPATAQVAYQEAKYVAKILNTIGKCGYATPKPFNFNNMGKLAYLGDWRAVYDRSGAKSGPKTTETGRVAWLLWRSAYFSMTLSWRNKILVPVYWSVHLFYHAPLCDAHIL
ncbi:FAD/NAD(P)-binding domain-containing protein [Ramaria rubella]|nr:FAD/NAD(P)-binding domain-containing protein [Ramaria rubella]